MGTYRLLYEGGGLEDGRVGLTERRESGSQRRRTEGPEGHPLETSMTVDLLGLRPSLVSP